jgi:major membrane immunogen (membrane-anchored lipoprotein)
MEKKKFINTNKRKFCIFSTCIDNCCSDKSKKQKTIEGFPVCSKDYHIFKKNFDEKKIAGYLKIKKTFQDYENKDGKINNDKSSSKFLFFIFFYSFFFIFFYF